MVFVIQIYFRVNKWNQNKNKLHLENNEDFEKLYVAILQFVLKGIFLETLKEEKICFPEKHSFD